MYARTVQRQFNIPNLVKALSQRHQAYISILQTRKLSAEKLACLNVHRVTIWGPSSNTA